MYMHLMIGLLDLAIHKTEDSEFQIPQIFNPMKNFARVNLASVTV